MKDFIKETIKFCIVIALTCIAIWCAYQLVLMFNY